MIYVPPNIATFASCRECSDEIALAIFEIAEEGDEARMWQDPTEAEQAAVIKRAWELAPEEDVLHWGVERILRSPY
jgi:hypothetical protein